jgi:hypothetical protein
MKRLQYQGTTVGAGAETDSNLLSGTRMENTPQAKSGFVRLRFGVHSTTDDDTVVLTVGNHTVCDGDAICKCTDGMLDRTMLMWEQVVPAGQKVNLAITFAAAATAMYFIEYEY